MEYRAGKRFRVSTETAPIVIEALRHYANAALGNNAAYRVWDSREQHVEEVLATASLILVGKAAFAAAIEQYPGVRLTLRHGIRVIDKT